MTDIAARLRDAALERDARMSRRRQLACDILRLSPPEYMGGLVEIEIVDDEPRCFAAEVISRKPDRTERILWAIAVDGSRLAERFYNLDCALLAIVAWRNGANGNDRGWSFAARALGVSIEEAK